MTDPSAADSNPGFTQSFAEKCQCVLEPKVLMRNLVIAFVVGIVLSMINQFDVLMAGTLNGKIALKLFGNFLVPFLVSSISAIVNRNPK